MPNEADYAVEKKPSGRVKGPEIRMTFKVGSMDEATKRELCRVFRNLPGGPSCSGETASDGSAE